MKTLKYLACALAASATLSFVGCVKNSTDCPIGEDMDGEQIYISNTTSTFYIQTAEEKKTTAAELALYGHGITVSPSATATDDKDITLPVVRMNGVDALSVTFTVALPTTNIELFTLPSGSSQKGTEMVGDVEYTTYTVPASFAEGAVETGIVIGFDITKLSSNTSYPFVATLDEAENGSYYGSSNFEFEIYHSAPVHNPWVEVGKIDLSENWYEVGPYEGVICIHEHDFTDDSFTEVAGEKVINPDPTKRTLKKQAYYRFCIPYYMYQIATASIASEDGVFVEGDEKYFENCNGIIFQLDANYDFKWDYSAKKYTSPLAEDITTGTKNQYLRGAWGYNHTTGGASSLVYDGYSTFNSGLRASWYFYTSTSYSNGTHAGNNYDLMMMLCDYDAGSLYGATMDVTWTWKTNNLVDDWDNFFKVDYNNLSYEGVAEGTFTSEFQPECSGEGSLYKAMDQLYHNEVFYMSDPYKTSSSTQNIGIAVLRNDGSVSVANNLPTGLSILGKPVYMHQSETLESSIETSASGNIVKVVAGIDYKFEDGTCIGSYTETFAKQGTDNTVDAFVGTYTMAGYEIYCPYGGKVSLTKLASTVTITKVDDLNVTIEGLIADTYSSYYFAGKKMTLSGVYDPETDQVRIPAQYYMTGDDATSCDYGFAYFQPGETTYGAYNTSAGAYYISVLGSTATECALRRDASTGKLWIENSLSEPNDAYSDGYSVELYAANDDGDAFESIGSIYTTFAMGYYFTTLTPKSAQSSKTALSVKNSKPQLASKPISEKSCNRIAGR